MARQFPNRSLPAVFVGTVWLLVLGSVVTAKPNEDDEKVAGDRVDNETEYRKLQESTIGKLLLEDRKSKILVGAKVNGDRVDSASIDDVKHDVGVRITWRGAERPPEVEYSVAPSTTKPIQMAVWTDVNGDGVFDFRLLAGNWPQFNNETGPRAYIDGRWVQAGREPDNKDQLNRPSVVTPEGKRYEFDFTGGRWVPALKPGPAPTTRPAP